MELSEITPEIWCKRELECQAFVKENYNNIPLLNVNRLEELRDKGLVKYYGMVQDMHDPEFYLRKYEVFNEDTNETTLQDGRYVDVLHFKEKEKVNQQSTNNVTSERKTLVITTVPGLNDWVQNYEREKYMFTTSSTSGIPSTSNKRPLEMEVSTNETESNSNISNKRSSNVIAMNSNSSESVALHDRLLNLPLPNCSGKTCHVKLYENFDAIKLNDVVEVVGFLSLDPLLIEGDSDDYGNFKEIQMHNPPPSLVPRIHCIAWKIMKHNNCLLDDSNPRTDGEEFLNLKKELLFVFTQLFLGDSLAAEYFIYQLISKVFVVTESTVVGNFALNISHIPVEQVPEYGKQLNEIIELLLPKSYYLAMSLKNMNELSFVPKKDYECNSLTSGILQLSNNTHFILDETKLAAGELNERGVQNIGALENAITWQTVKYDFNYYQMPFNCDIPFLILSEGKSLLPHNFRVELQPDSTCINTFNEIVEAVKYYLNTHSLNRLRIYLTLARFAQYRIDDSNISAIENDFVTMRQEGTASADDLSDLLVLTRLICLSAGKTYFDYNCWKRACTLEMERKNRLK